MSISNMMTRLLYAVIITAAVSHYQVNVSYAGAVSSQHVRSIYTDDAGTGLKHPEGITCDNKAQIIIADTENGRLLRYSYREQTLKEAGQIKLPQLPYPVILHMNSKGEIYALDGRNRHIVRLSSGGSFIGTIQPSEIPSPSAFTAKSFTIDGKDNIYILDVFSGRVLVLDAEGAFQRAVRFPDKYGFFSDVAVDPFGNILMTDSSNARIAVARENADGFSWLTDSLDQYVRFPSWLTTDDRGRIYLSDRNGGRVVVIGQDGSYLGQLTERGWNEGLLNYPSQICINSSGELFITDTMNSRVQIFNIVR